jgi:hypothetical protein
MSTFDFVALIHHIYGMSSRFASSMRYVPFCTSYFNDTWTLNSSTFSYEGQSHNGMEIPSSTEEIMYQVVLDSAADLDHVSLQKNKDDHVLKPIWATSSSFYHD